MVQIGTIEYEARVTGVAEAKQNADEFASSQEDVAQSSQEAATSGGFLAGTLGFLAGREEEAGEEADRANTKVDVLSSGLYFLGTTAVGTAAKFLGLSGALGAVSSAAGTVYGVLSGLTLSGIVGSVTGAVSGFVSWMAAGSAGALAFAGAIGFALGTLGVWILHVTGALDAVRGFGEYVGGELPGVVRDGLLTLLAVTVGPMAVFGNFIAGTVAGGFDEGFARARKTISVFEGAYMRTMGRVKDAGIRAANGIANAFANLDDVIIGTVRRAWNSNIPATIGIPSVTIAGQTFGGGGISIPRLQVGGMVEESGMAVVHKGESVIPEPLTSAASRGGGGGGGTTNIGRVVVNLSGDFDPSDMSKRELENFADQISEAVGKSTNTRAGVR